ncbi:MAG: hypothetical protein DMD43_10450 [Gemmatimonadetes bacterium]|nr:MAG: hypothetical protein DMD43_10450 [Gemmatimonadota bacterium]
MIVLAPSMNPEPVRSKLGDSSPGRPVIPVITGTICSGTPALASNVCGAVCKLLNASWNTGWPFTTTLKKSGAMLPLSSPSHESSTYRSNLSVCACPAVSPVSVSVCVSLLNRPPKRVNTPGTELSVVLLAHCACAPLSNVSENTSVAPWLTRTLSSPHDSLFTSSSPPSANWITAVLPVGVKLSVMSRWMLSG